YRNWVAIGARGLRSDIDDVGAPPSHVGRVRDRNRWVQEPATIGEGIRGHIEDTHDQRAAVRKQRREGERKWFWRGSRCVSEGTEALDGGRFAGWARDCQAGLRPLIGDLQRQRLGVFDPPLHDFLRW